MFTFYVSGLQERIAVIFDLEFFLRQQYRKGTVYAFCYFGNPPAPAPDQVKKANRKHSKRQ